MPLRVIFMGTPDFAAESLRKIFDAGHKIAAVYTQPPRPGGRRGLELIKTPVHLEAERLGLEVRTPVSMKNPVEQDGFADLKADVAVVVAYGLLLPKPVLEATRFGAFNGHASALPRWRGAAPIQRAILAGDRQTAVMIMKMDEGLDTGPVALERSITIGENETFGDLQDRMAAISAELMVKALSGLEAGTLKLKPQAEDGATYARKIDKAETRIDWSRPARDIHNFIRGLSPVPGAWCEMETKGRIERVKVLRSLMADGSGTAGELLDERLRIATGSGALRLTRLQKAGGKAVDAEDFLRGSPVSKVS